MSPEVLGALAFGIGESGPRFLGLDLPTVQIAPRRGPERRLGNKGFQTGLGVSRAPGTLDDDFVYTVTLCTHNTSSYTVVIGM